MARRSVNRAGPVLPLLLFALLAGVAACGQRPRAEQAAVPSPVPTFTPAPIHIPIATNTAVPEPAATAGAAELDLEGLSEPTDRASFRATMRFRETGTEAGQPVDLRMEWLFESTTVPEALHAKRSSQDVTGEWTGEREVYLLGDVVYVRHGDQWGRVLTAEEALEDMGGLQPQSVLHLTCGWRRQADAEYEGVGVQRWTLTTEDLLGCKSAAEMAEIGNLTAASGTLYLADGTSILYMELILEGAGLQNWSRASEGALDQGRLEFLFAMSDMNQPFTIEAPAEALSSRGPLDPAGLSVLAGLTSYRASLRMRSSGSAAGEAVDDTVEVLVEYTGEPRAQHIRVGGRRLDGVDSTVERDVYRFEDTTYVKVDGQWQREPTTEEIVADADLVDPRDLLEDTCGWTWQTDVEQQGIRAEHWIMTAEGSRDCLDAARFDRFGTVTATSGDLLIAAEGDRILHMELILEGTGLESWLGSSEQVLDQGRIEILFDLSDVNQPFLIEPPAEALSGEALPEEPPIPPLARMVVRQPES